MRQVVGIGLGNKWDNKTKKLIENSRYVKNDNIEMKMRGTGVILLYHGYNFINKHITNNKFDIINCQFAVHYMFEKMFKLPKDARFKKR